MLEITWTFTYLFEKLIPYSVLLTKDKAVNVEMFFEKIRSRKIN